MLEPPSQVSFATYYIRRFSPDHYLNPISVLSIDNAHNSHFISALALFLLPSIYREYEEVTIPFPSLRSYQHSSSVQCSCFYSLWSWILWLFDLDFVFYHFCVLRSRWICFFNLQMSKTGALDLASGLGGKIDKSEVLSAVEKYKLTLSLSLAL